MGLLDKVKFWKKKDEFGELPDFGGMGSGMPKSPDDNFGNIGLGDQGPPGLGQEMPAIDNTGLPELGKPPAGTPPQPQASFGAQPSFGTQMPPPDVTARPFAAAPPSMPPVHVDEHPPADTKLTRDVEIVSYKLDTLKSAIDSINQRLANIERLAFESMNQRQNYQQPKQKW